MTDVPTTGLQGQDLPEEAAQWFALLAQARRTTLPRRLAPPGPDAAQCTAMLLAAAAAPDHRQLLPWRFVEVPAAARPALADAFERALRTRDPGASAEEIARARDKAARAPWLALAVARTRGGDPEVPALERVLSAGCAIQNLLLSATAMGFGSALTSGKAVRSPAIRELFTLADDEDALCFVSVGTATAAKPGRIRPEPCAFHRLLEPPAASSGDPR